MKPPPQPTRQAHTPGPITVKYELVNYTLWDKNGKLIANVIEKEDANLYAAAPELLEAAKAYLNKERGSGTWLESIIRKADGSAGGGR